ncbi:hypothetical protein MFIFM68171_02244 [Madurella fahalii]|uniref:Uncharacterized protein n=1 Tax=Madurella fahalii TaxID=1157608 RepID=A0ABQ0G2Q5_9PEZI
MNEQNVLRNTPIVQVPVLPVNDDTYHYIARRLWDLDAHEVGDSVYLHIHDTIQIIFQQDHHVITTIGNLTDLVGKLKQEYSAGEELYQWIPDWFRQPLEGDEADLEAKPGHPPEPEVINDELRTVTESLPTIQNFIRTILLWQGPQGVKDFDYDRSFPTYFTLRDLNLMGRFHIRWTNNILSHLRVSRYRVPDHFRPTLHVFQQARVLEKLAINGPDWYRPTAKEALLTMGLPVPRDEINPEWFDYCCRNNQKNAYQPDSPLLKFVVATLLWAQPWLPQQLKELLPPCNIDLKVKDQSARLKTRRVGEFRIFQSRLLTLKEDFDNASPWSVSAWWYDKRKGRDVASLWATICSFLCALVALILAAVSALIAILLASEANGYARTGNSLASLANDYASNASTDAAKSVEAITTFTTIHIAGTTNYISSNINQINNNAACLAAMQLPPQPLLPPPWFVAPTLEALDCIYFDATVKAAAEISSAATGVQATNIGGPTEPWDAAEGVESQTTPTQTQIEVDPSLPE